MKVSIDMVLLKYKRVLSVSIKRVQRLMKQLGINSIVIKKFRPTRSAKKL